MFEAKSGSGQSSRGEMASSKMKEKGDLFNLEELQKSLTEVEKQNVAIKREIRVLETKSTLKEEILKERKHAQLILENMISETKILIEKCQLDFQIRQNKFCKLQEKIESVLDDNEALEKELEYLEIVDQDLDDILNLRDNKRTKARAQHDYEVKNSEDTFQREIEAFDIEIKEKKEEKEELEQKLGKILGIRADLLKKKNSQQLLVRRKGNKNR